MLNNTQLLDLNRSMLNLGAPIEVDNQGYNQIDFSNMYRFASYQESELTKVDSYKIASALSRYKNTQLTAYAAELDSTVEALYTSLKAITIVEFSQTEVSLNWSFSQNVSDFIKTMDRTTFKWKKTTMWILSIKWALIDPLLDVFEQNGYDVDTLREYKTRIAAGETIQGMKVEKSKPDESKRVYKVQVNRDDKAIDTLELKFDYNKTLIEAIGAVQNTYYTSNNKAWNFYIEDSIKVYEALKLTGVKLDLTTLEPWKALVESWQTEYTMKPIPTCLPFKPYDFQIEDIKELLKGRWRINGNDMGCGKTFEDIMVGYSIPLPKLVICPATLRLNWEMEIKMVDPDADITILYDNSEYTTSEWTIVGYPSVSKHLKNLEASNFQVIMADEAHYCQAINNSGNPDSNRANAVLRLTATAGWVLPTTGTPKTNRNKNLFNCLRMIRHPLTRGKWSFQDYGVDYCDGHKGNWGWDFEGNSNDDKLHDLIAPYMVRHLKTEVLPDLKKARRIIPVKVDLREYDLEIAEYLNHRSNKQAEQLARLMRARMILATQKVGETIDFTKDLIADGEKVVLVTCFTEVVRVLEKAFSGNCVKIVGGMSDKAKQDAKEQFQKGKPQVIILNMIAGGVGITLTAAHNLVINDYDFVPGNIIQVEDRICRSGQTAEFCNIYYITAKGADVEEDFVDMLTYKSETINNAIDGGEGEAIDFRSLVEKSAGKTRSTEVRKIIKADDIPQTVQAAKSSKPTAEKSKKAEPATNWKAFTTEQLETKLEELGGSYKKCENANVNRMRVIMALKKVMG